MIKDSWHFPRCELAKQILNMFEGGLSTSLIFFAPRRMGKTEFLLKDIQPYAQKKGWLVFYFSFLDAADTPQDEFTFALNTMMENNKILPKAGKMREKIKKISGGAAGLINANIEFNEPKKIKHTMKQLLSTLATNKKTLLLMDEIQTLAKHAKNESFIASLRTALDVYKDNIKVIFTGSSREGLRQMFSESTAPFFHFGQNLPFPELDNQFTNHLAEVYKKITKKMLDRDNLWLIFQEVEKVPQIARSIVERLVLNPDLSIKQAKELVLSEIFSGRAFEQTWNKLSTLERFLLLEIVNDVSALFSEETRLQLSNKIGITDLPTSTVQSAIRTLQKKCLIGKLPDRGNYYIDDPNFRRWIAENHQR